MTGLSIMLISFIISFYILFRINNHIEEKNEGYKKFVSFQHIFNEYNITDNEIDVILKTNEGKHKYGKLIKRIIIIDNKVIEQIDYIPHNIKKDTIFKEDKMVKYKLL